MNGGRLSVSTKHIAKEEKSGIRIISTIKKYWFIYLLAIPGFIFLVFFSYGPMYGIVLAFKDYKMNLGVLGSPWVGLAHYRELLSDPSFIQAFKNTIIINIYNLIFGFSFILQELQEQRRGVPQEFSVCGFDNIFSASIVIPGLTTVDHQLRIRCQAAVDMVISHPAMTYAAAPYVSMAEYMPRLIVRGSTGPVLAQG